MSTPAAPASGERPALVSVVLPVRNGGPLLDGQLAALAAQVYDGAWELVVADNGSTDGTQDLASSWAARFPVPLRVIDASARPGVGNARNAGSAAADGDLLVYCDADDVADPRWLAEIAEVARYNHVVAGWLDYSDVNDPVVVGWRPAMSRDEAPRACGWLPYAVGASFGIWKAVFDELGGFRQEFSRYGDDVDLSWRALLAGHRLALAPGSVMHYRFRPGLRATFKQFFSYGRSEPHLFKAFRPHGHPPRTVWRGIYGWLWILKHVVDVRHPVGRGAWVRELAFTAGRVRGAIEARVVYF